jgi:hypothetical protein
MSALVPCAVHVKIPHNPSRAVCFHQRRAKDLEKRVLPGVSWSPYTWKIEQKDKLAQSVLEASLQNQEGTQGVGLLLRCAYMHV